MLPSRQKVNMRSKHDQAVRKLVSKGRAAMSRFRRRFTKAGQYGQGHIGWLDYEDVVYRALEYQYWEDKASVIPFGNYYEFGLLNGASFSRCYRTMTALSKHLGYAGIKELGVAMHGFDSFEGMPEPGKFDQRVGWGKGAMACGQDKFVGLMDRAGIPRDSYQLHAGFFENSLTPELRKTLEARKPSLVMMDCDFYSSTKTVLEWLRPILCDGTIFMFDDIWAYMGHPNFGELRAIREFNERGQGLLVPHYFGGATGQVYVFTTGYTGEAYKQYLSARGVAATKNY
jgi:Macrocin-O-methyltransferase (TylF)